MDFFDVLRQGCTFGGTKLSKEVAFSKTTANAQEDLPPPRKAVVAPLDFFGYGSAATTDGAPASQPADVAEQSQPPELAVTAKTTSSASSKAKPKKNQKGAETTAKQEQIKQEAVTALRRRHKIHVGTGAPDPVESFDDMLQRGVPSWLVANLRSLKFERPTPIQMQCFPAVLAGNHVLASAPTGSGKTIAFLGPLLARLSKPGKAFARALIVDPSRELAKQTLDEFQKLTAGRKWAGRLLDKLAGDRAKNIRRLDVAVATPLRLAQLLKEGRLSLDATRHLVLDEADKLLDLGFAPQIDEILSYCPLETGGTPRQILMFSATLPPAVCELAGSILASPLRVSIGNVNAAAAEVEQKLLFITHEDGKLFSFRQLVQDRQLRPPALIFVQSKERAKELFGELVFDGVFVDAIHADRTKQQRDNTVQAFRTGKIWMLICTDLMARGVDFKGVETVVNYDFPQSASTYIHRIGRTGRAGRAGKAITFFTIDDFEALRSIVGVMRQSGCEVPEWMLRLKQRPKKERRMAEWRPPGRRRISTTAGWDIKQARKRKEEAAQAQTVTEPKRKKRRKQRKSDGGGAETAAPAAELAHQQLSVVFFGMTLGVGMSSPFPANVIGIYITFAVWFAVTVGILLGMDCLECFLHCMRLHWVEFQSKFYKGDGHPFMPFSHRDILAKSEEPQ